MSFGLSGFTFSLVVLYLCMRGVMKLGGFVATGGPYEIAHHAPNWIWLFPASFIGGFIFIVFNQVNARRIGGVNLLIWLWPAVFVTLGYNFFDFGFNPPGQESGVAWAWLICGIMFALMGGIPALFLLKNIFILIGRVLRGEPRQPQQGIFATFDQDSGRYLPAKLVTTVVFILSLASIAGGIYLGLEIFRLLST